LGQPEFAPQSKAIVDGEGCGGGRQTIRADFRALQLRSDGNPPPSPSSSSIWSGLYIGSGIFAIPGNGSKGHVGGDGEIGYDREFQNGLVVGVEAVGGYSPGLWANGPAKGFDFAETDVKVGYDMGRWMPYVETGVVLARLQTGANYVSVGQSADDLFSGPGHLRAAPRVGAGVEYAVTPNLHLDVNVSGGQWRGACGPVRPLGRGRPDRISRAR
jgi:outer membrane immunogenic protein